MMTDWKTETFGNEHAAYAERVAADELAAVRERAEARMGGKCPTCGGSGEVFFGDTMRYEPCPECTVTVTVASETCATEETLTEVEVERLLDLGYGIG